MKISVVMSTYNRAHLLTRSLRGYWQQMFSRYDYEIIVVDDGSTDDTKQLCESVIGALPVRYVAAQKPKDVVWRDCAATINEGLRLAAGELVIATHPEVIPGLLSLDHLWQSRSDDAYSCCKVYYLTPRDQERIDTVPIATQGNLAIRQLEGFYEQQADILGPSWAYTHTMTDKHQHWESWVFGGLTNKTWHEIGGMTEFDTWGSIDIDFMERRKVLGIENRTMLVPETIVIHQNHDDPTKNVVTPRDMDKAMASLMPYRTRQDAIKANL